VELKWDLAWVQGQFSSLKAENIPTYKNNHSSIILSDIQAK
jgi:hypothetical protein